MDVHRSRFVPYPASAINTLTFSHPSDIRSSKSNDATVRLAVGRANGDIEIWNPAGGAWVHETTFRGGKDRSVEGLAWIQETDDDGRAAQLRLFSIGYSSSVTEWSLTTGLPLRHSSGNSSEVWCIAAQPRWNSSGGAPREGQWTGQNIVAGCADGTLAVLSTADNDLQFQRYLTRPTRKRARCLSVTYQSRDIVVAGFADSTIRVFDMRSGSLVRAISFGSGPAGGPKEILVWSVKCLPNGDIVSGDSTGDIRVFDGKYYSQIQRVAGHEADVLAVAVSQDGQTIFSVGPDRRTVVYQLGSESQASSRRWWNKTSHQRHHSHDVKALAIYESRSLSVLASGGVDTNLHVHPVRGHSDEYSRSIAGLPQSPPIASSSNRLLASWWEREVWIWQIQRSMKSAEPHRLLTKVALKGEANVASASISNDGSILAVATAAEVRIFRLRLKGLPPVETLRVRKLDAPKTLQNKGARLVQLSGNGKWLAVVRHDSSIQIYRIAEDGESSGSHRVLSTPQELIRLQRKSEPMGLVHSALGRYDRTVTRIEFDNDGHAFVAGDLAGHIDSWLLAGHEDVTAAETDAVGQEPSMDSDEDSDEDDAERKIITFGQYWTRNPSAHLIPKLEAAPLVLTFRHSKSAAQPAEPNGNPAVHATRHNPHAVSHELPKGPLNLVVVTAKHEIYEFDIIGGVLTKWSRQNPSPALPSNFRSVRDRVVGSLWHVTSRWERLWLYGHNWLYMFDLSQDLDGPMNGILVNGDSKASKKRKREDETMQSQVGTSGAGSRRKEKDLEGIGMTVRTIDDGTKDERFGRDQIDTGAETDDEEANGTPVNGAGAGRQTMEDSDDEDPQHEQSEDESRKGCAKTWHTFKYRPILGVAPLSAEVQTGGTATGDPVLEVALIERPLWDLDLPPRFVGVHERNA